MSLHLEENYHEYELLIKEYETTECDSLKISTYILSADLSDNAQFLGLINGCYWICERISE